MSQVTRKNHIRYLTCADRALEVIICTDSTLSYPLHNHISVFTIGLVIKGSLSVTIGQTSHLYCNGQTFIIPPYLPHSINAADSYTLLSLCIREELFCRCNYDMQILKACVNKALRSVAVANKLSWQQLVQLTDCLDSLSGKAELFRHNTGDQFINNLKQRLERAPENKFSINDMAQATCTSKYHLIRCFKRAVGLTPHQFQLQNRIRKAQRLLSSADTITKAALTAGFCDQSHFIKHFEKYTGLTPTDYKNSCHRL